MNMRYQDIARIVHEANRAYQIAIGEEVVSLPWDDTDAQTQDSAVDGVRFVASGGSAKESHENWVIFKLNHGWVLGPVKSTEDQTHPLLVPYAELPEEHKLKDHLFVAIVNVLTANQ